MTPRQTIALGCRFLAIYALLRSINELSGGFGAIQGKLLGDAIMTSMLGLKAAPSPITLDDLVPLILAWTPCALEFFIALFMWRLAPAIATNLLVVPSIAPASLEPQIHINLRAIILAGVAGLLLVQVVPDFATAIVSFGYLASMTRHAWTCQYTAGLAAAALRLAMASILMIYIGMLRVRRV